MPSTQSAAHLQRVEPIKNSFFLKEMSIPNKTDPVMPCLGAIINMPVRHPIHLRVFMNLILIKASIIAWPKQKASSGFAEFWGCKFGDLGL